MSVINSIKEYWLQWEECSVEEYIKNEKDTVNYCYIIDGDTNKIARYMKRKIILL